MWGEIEVKLTQKFWVKVTDSYCCNNMADGQNCEELKRRRRVTVLQLFYY